MQEILNEIQKRLNEIENRLNTQHVEHFQWAKTIYDNQQNIKKVIGIKDESLPFEPCYHKVVPLDSKEPEIYNKYGEKLKVFFLSDSYTAYSPYGSSRYFIYDRYNYGLKTHFYTYDEAFRTVGKPDRRFASLNESRAILPQCFDNYLKNKEYIANNFDLVFSHDAEILNTFPNARYMPSCSYWYGRDVPPMHYGKNEKGEPVAHNAVGLLSEETHKYKSKNISILASPKQMCPMHIIRQNLAWKCKKEGLADTYGKFDGGPFVPIEVPFQYYRYSIVVENDVTPYYFTEKIGNCFASQTIPVYLGATKIHKFFNPDGIITFKLEDCDHIEDILKQCTPEEYERRLPAIIDNYHRILLYDNASDILYNNYIRQYFE